MNLLSQLFDGDQRFAVCLCLPLSDFALDVLADDDDRQEHKLQECLSSPGNDLEWIPGGQGLWQRHQREGSKEKPDIASPSFNASFSLEQQSMFF